MTILNCQGLIEWSSESKNLREPGNQCSSFVTNNWTKSSTVSSWNDRLGFLILARTAASASSPDSSSLFTYQALPYTHVSVSCWLHFTWLDLGSIVQKRTMIVGSFCDTRKLSYLSIKYHFCSWWGIEPVGQVDLSYWWPPWWSLDPKFERRNLSMDFPKSIVSWFVKVIIHDDDLQNLLILPISLIGGSNLLMHIDNQCLVTSCRSYWPVDVCADMVMTAPAHPKYRIMSSGFPVGCRNA